MTFKGAMATAAVTLAATAALSGIAAPAHADGLAEIHFTNDLKSFPPVSQAYVGVGSLDLSATLH